MDIVFQTKLYKPLRGKTAFWEVRVKNTSHTRGALVEVHEQKSDQESAKVKTSVIARGVNVGKINERTPLNMALLKAHDMVIKKRQQGFLDVEEQH